MLPLRINPRPQHCRIDYIGLHFRRSKIRVIPNPSSLRGNASKTKTYLGLGLFSQMHLTYIDDATRKGSSCERVVLFRDPFDHSIAEVEMGESDWPAKNWGGPARLNSDTPEISTDLNTHPQQSIADAIMIRQAVYRELESITSLIPVSVKGASRSFRYTYPRNPLLCAREAEWYV